MRALSDILEEVRSKISASCKKVGRDEKGVTILAVTKTHGSGVVREAWDLGLDKVGENKVQEAMWKKAESPAGVEWHLIGHLQTNKVRHALETFDYIHSVDSLKLIDKIAQVAEELGKEPHILLEVNVSGEKSKTGMNPALVPAAVEKLLSYKRLWFEGFMTMAPFSENKEDARPYFKALRELRDKTEKDFSISLPELSMGMSGDYEVAVEEGATFVRLGTVLFGERPKIRSVRSEGSDIQDVEDNSRGRFSKALDSYSGEGPTYKILD